MHGMHGGKKGSISIEKHTWLSMYIFSPREKKYYLLQYIMNLIKYSVLPNYLFPFTDNRLTESTNFMDLVD